MDSNCCRGLRSCDFAGRERLMGDNDRCTCKPEVVIGSRSHLAFGREFFVADRDRQMEVRAGFIGGSTGTLFASTYL
jgi:hypothetical protein